MSDRTTPKQQRGIDTRTAILEAANTVYERVGWDYFKMQDVQKEFGRSIGTIYRYFGDRVALLQALLVYRGEERTDSPAETPVQAPEVDPQGALALEVIESIKNWCDRVIEGGEGKHDLKTAGTFIRKAITDRGL